MELTKEVLLPFTFENTHNLKFAKEWQGSLPKPHTLSLAQVDFERFIIPRSATLADSEEEAGYDLRQVSDIPIAH